MAKTTEMVEVAIERLVPYERNAKQHPTDQIELLKRSIEEFGFLSPCLIDADNNIIAGHGRVEAAKALGMETVPCVYIEGLTDEQRRAYILADNRLTEMGGWDMETVSTELTQLSTEGFDINLTGFTIDNIIIEEVEDIDEEEPREEVAEEDLEIQQGTIWRLGDHRLMCGDSADADNVAQLMGGNYADLLETDPPYNVDVEGAAGKIENDDMPRQQFYNFLVSAFKNANAVMKPGAAFYIWHADLNGLDFRLAAEEAGLTIKQNLIWVKNQFTIGRQDYQWQHEPCLYGWKEGASHYFIDMRTLTTIQEYDKLESMTKEELIERIQEMTNNISTVEHEHKPTVSELHPTMKPLSLIKKHVRNSSQEGEIVLDLFGGSGTTLIACEEMGRICYMMEYDPHYAGVIIRRWEEQTGRKAVKV